MVLKDDSTFNRLIMYRSNCFSFAVLLGVLVVISCSLGLTSLCSCKLFNVEKHKCIILNLKLSDNGNNIIFVVFFSPFFSLQNS